MNLKTEILAGITTFLTMSYIIFVNPMILSADGTEMSFTAVMTATILVSFLSTLCMGLFAKLPFALAPGMGLNAFFTYTIILDQQIPWPQALGLVFWSGVFFVLISLTPLRESIAKSIPKHIRLAMAAGIGLFLAFIGLKSAGIVISHPVTFVQAAPFSVSSACVFIGILLTILLFKKNVPGNFLIGILFTWFLAAIVGEASFPDAIISRPDFSNFMQVDILGALRWSYLPAILTLIMTDLFDSLSTFIGVAETANLKDDKGETKNLKQALTVDAFATLFSGLFGTSSATTYVESSAGVSAGGRTGVTSIVTAICFIPFLFLGPFVKAIPSFASAPVLIIVGILMFKNIKDISLDKFEELIPVFLTLTLIPLTFSITSGIVWGLLTHTILFVLMGRRRELNIYSYILGLISLVFIINH